MMSSEDRTRFFTADDRERIWTQLVEMAESDPQITGAAAVGSSASGRDRWSDLDLTLALTEGSSIQAVMERWTERLLGDYGAAFLFDLAAGETIYRVFLFPGSLQVDISFSPARAFGSRGPRFQALFGEPIQHPEAPKPEAGFLVGYGAHHCLRAHVYLERGKVWQALHWINELRELGMTLACKRYRLDEAYGRGFDQLPEHVLAGFALALPESVELSNLRMALRTAGWALMEEAALAGALDPRVAAGLRPILATGE
jgi:hypothetical protein